MGKLSVYKRCQCVLLAVIVLWAAVPMGSAAEQQPAEPVSWLLDPGHGGNSRGAAGGSHKEKEDALRLALAVGRILEANGQKVGYTRTDDITMSLEQRVELQEEGGYTYFVSLHRNAANQAATGFEIHTYTDDGPGTASYALAENIRREMLEIGLTAPAEAAGDHAFWDRGIKQSNFHVLRETSCPSILIEAGFIDTDRDNRLFDERFDELAACIAAGCLRQIGIDDPEEPPAEEPEPVSGPLRWLIIAGLIVLGLAGAACIGFAVLLLIVNIRINHRRRHG